MGQLDGYPDDFIRKRLSSAISSYGRIPSQPLDTPTSFTIMQRTSTSSHPGNLLQNIKDFFETDLSVVVDINDFLI
jgi:hypothetical protein